MDFEIIEKSKKGDKDSQKQIYMHYRDKIYTFCLFHVKNHDDAEDMTQEIFFKIFQSLRRYRKGNFSAWIHKIAVNHILNSITRRKSYEIIPELAISTKKKDIDRSIEIERALSKMPAKLSLLLVLKEKEGFDYKELSKIFGVPMGTISSRLAKARMVFRKHYGGEK